MTPEQREKARLRKRRWLQRPENKAKQMAYRRSRRGMEVMRQAVARYNRSEKARQARIRYRTRRYADPVRRELTLQSNRRWKQETENGQKVQFGLPTFAPGNLLKACKLLRALRQEMRT